MARHAFTDRPGFRQDILTREDRPDTFTVHTREDLDPIKAHCKNVRETRAQRHAETMRPVAEIPMSIYMLALENAESEGLTVAQYCKRWAMRPENADFRLSTGSV